MARLDKEMFERLQYRPGIAEHVPVPAKVAAILKRKCGTEILVCYLLKAGGYKDVKKDCMMMVYFDYKGYGDPRKTNGYSSDSMDWVSLAREVAEAWPKYKVKHKKQKL